MTAALKLPGAAIPALVSASHVPRAALQFLGGVPVHAIGKIDIEIDSDQCRPQRYLYSNAAAMRRISGETI
jgi:hypothetical protein